MARDTRAAAHKRAREKAQQARQKEKQQKRLEAREKKGAAKPLAKTPILPAFSLGPSPGPNGSTMRKRN